MTGHGSKLPFEERRRAALAPKKPSPTFYVGVSGEWRQWREKVAWATLGRRLFEVGEGSDAVAAGEEFGVVLLGLGVVEEDGAGAVGDVDAVDAVVGGFHGFG